MLSGACAILLQSKEKFLHEGTNFFDGIMTVMAIIAVPILLHGLFDTMVKKELNILALLVAIAAFAWLAWLISRLKRAAPIATAPLVSGPRFRAHGARNRDQAFGMKQIKRELNSLLLVLRERAGRGSDFYRSRSQARRPSPRPSPEY